MSRFPAEGGTTTVQILGEDDCDCFSEHGVSSWVSVAFDDPATSTTATVSCAPNPGPHRRQGIVRIGSNCHRVIQGVSSGGDVHLWGDVPGAGCADASPPRSAVQVAADAFNTVALLADGTVWACGETARVPPSLRDVVHVTARLALTSDGTLVPLATDVAVPAELPPVVDVASGRFHDVALHDDGTISCWSPRDDVGCEVPEDLGPVLAVAAGWANTLVLLADGTVREWGDDGTIGTPPNLPQVVAIAKGWHHSVVATRRFGLRMWAGPKGHEASDGFSTAVGVVHRLGAGGSASLAIDGEFHLWGAGPAADVPIADVPGPVVDAAVGPSHGISVRSPDACGNARTLRTAVTVSADGGSATVSFRRNGDDCTITPLVDNPWLTIVGIVEDGRDVTIEVAAEPLPGTNRRWATIAFDQQYATVVQIPPTRSPVFVSTTNTSHSVTPPAGLEHVVEIATGTSHTIALLESGEVVGWGSNGHGQADPPGDVGEIVEIRAGQAHNLALTVDGDVHAWGWNCCGQTDVPPDLPPAIAIATSFNGSAALLETGEVRYWGSDVTGEDQVPAGLDDVVHLAGGAGHFLALRTDGSVVGWGFDSAGQATPPEDLSGVVQLAGGLYHSLALLADGTVRSWGYGPYGEADVPDGLHGVVAIDAGSEGIERHGFSAALLEDGHVVFWGHTSWGASALPVDFGPVRAISAFERRVAIVAGLPPADCNGDGEIDSEQIATGLLSDGNNNGIPDCCEGEQSDYDDNGVPDHCDCLTDVNGDAVVDGADIAAILAFWGPAGNTLPSTDINRDGSVNGADLAVLLGGWGPCP